MEQMPILCTCTKRFKTDGAMRQHQRDSPRHVDAPQAPERAFTVDELLKKLSLQDQEADHGFIPFLGGESTTVLAQNPDLRIFSWLEAAAPIKPLNQATAGVNGVSKGEGTKKNRRRKKNKGTGNILRMGGDGGSSWKPNANTGQMMDMLQDQDWALCDKDCGWCGHCGEGVMY